MKDDAGDTAALEERLQRIYAAIPGINCKGLCQESCGSIGMTNLEQDIIARKHGRDLPLLEIFDDLCPALSPEGRCTVYDDRPFICRLWGTVDKMPCEHGCEPGTGLFTDAFARALRERIDRLDASYRRSRT
jgi:Fe-S-cluster containining protein